MNVIIPKENLDNETRVAATPGTVKELIKSGVNVLVESHAGMSSHVSDKDYENAGATILDSKTELFAKADIVLKVLPPTLDQIVLLRPKTALVSFCQTTRDIETVRALKEQSVTGFSMHLIPRTTLAQKMDALSSQANIAGYKAVLMAASRLGVYMPLLMTAAGTIRPAKVLVLGAGVAGLQAIATAKRLGAQVEAFDVRPVVKEQVESLGAKFIEVESKNDEGVGDGGYAKETSDDYKKRQQELIHEHISKSDVVITTALIPGRPAPLLIPTTMVEAMGPGSIIMDLASENGGNCELTKKDEIIDHNGVTIDGTSNIPGSMPVHASELYAKNITAFLTYMIKDGELQLDLEDEIISGAMYTHHGEITNEPTEEALKR
ncbi:MAG: Re/Si-specific NAD(P)(+) transhydrogenase subunit alpha [Candidatus Marinimicrobia bacterium]|jgi:NAD(P) transhydrogenase subunit alpha|nr:Re/Si-specific NAD(P)(+) transhydrogenase subunit alpha [Candidatus Neomarinimicrobiota bacterium]|tara:strand:+ start:203 stop:1336 length:1134 start_codon:yes stop_codon:yes gene_type:complete